MKASLFTQTKEELMKVEIACVLDRSGSMTTIRDDAIGGFNAFLKDQQAIPGEAKLTLALFDDQYDVIHDAVDIASVPELTAETFVPRGWTALYDAVGRTIDGIGARLSAAQDKPEKVIFVILTDGMENRSKEYTQERIAEMIKHQSEKYGWEFIFLAANQDAFATGAQMNIPARTTANFAANSVGTQSAYQYACDVSTRSRTNE